MESLEELKSWDTYRVFMRKYLKRCGQEVEPLYVSKARLDFDINGQTWKGHGILLGKKARMLAKKMRQEGELFLEGTCTCDGKSLRVDGFGEKHVKGAERTLKKLKLGFEIVAGDGDAEDTDDQDPKQAEWKKRKAQVASQLKRALAAGGPNASALRDQAKAMVQREKRGDWDGALRVLGELEPLLANPADDPKRRKARQRLEQMDKNLDQLLAKLEKLG